MSGITLHPRYFIVRHGALDISDAIIAVCGEILTDRRRSAWHSDRAGWSLA